MREEIDYVLARAGILNQFAVVVSTGDVTTYKPDPACYLKALELLNARRGESQILPVTASECLVIEDSPPGKTGRQRPPIPIVRFETLGMNAITASKMPSSWPWAESAGRVPYPLKA